MPTFNSYSLKIGADYSEIYKGGKEVDKFLSSYNKSLTVGANTEAVSKAKSLNALEAQRLSLKRRINQAEKLGILDISTYRNVHKSELDISNIRSKNLELQNKIVDKQRELVSIANAEKGKKRDPVFNMTDKRAAALERDLFQEMQRRKRMLQGEGEALKKIKGHYELLTKDVASINSQKSLNNFQRRVVLWKEENKAITQQLGKLSGMQRLTKGLTNSMHNFAQSYISTFAAIGAGVGLVSIGKKFENVSAVMLQASGNAQQAAKDFAFVRQMSSEMGLSLTDTAKSYAKFAVAARSGADGMGLEESNQIFKDFALTLRATGLSADESSGALLALRQMLSGPVIQGQEMNQMIERLPQFTAAANEAVKQMGFNTGTYKKAVETATVESKEFVRIVTASMKKASIESGAYGKMLDSLTAAEGRFQLSNQKASNQIFTTGRMKQSLTHIMDGLAGIVKALTPALTTMAFGFNMVVESLAAVIRMGDGAVKALGFEGGLSSVLAFLVGPAGVLLLISRMNALHKVMKRLVLTKKLLNTLDKQGIVLQTIKLAMKNPLAAAGIVGLAGAAGYGMAKTVSNVTNNVTNDIKVDAQGASADEVANKVSDLMQLGLEPQ